MMPLRKSLVLLSAAALAVSGCVSAVAPPDISPRPEERVEAPQQSPESLALARYYQGIEVRLTQDGLLRTDSGQRDAPFSAATLAANFERIALYDEYALIGGRFVQQQTPARLRRWEQPVRIQPHFGRLVDPAQQAEDRAILTTYATRLARATGHPVSTVRTGGNFHVLYLGRDDLREVGDLVRSLVPGIGAEVVAEIENLPRSTFCSVYAFSEAGGRSVYVAAIAIIRDEHPPLLRRSCVHEEVAQGLGLPNDSPAARPSIFNDDEEFALLTRHDELLLQMLYDPRLSPGLRPEEARPTLRQIAQELVGGSS
ncbi:MAG: DUF2927 domain-containing protein [Roseicyclus sp.]|uniref:DUF2927 domain-containing protein n=1 Tax=Roseicyclus sp. TaxID=1914329 RepID=UPI003A8779D0